jgi:hypothetical protein
MITTNFDEKYFLYENMAIWEISSMEDFFSSHTMMMEIFENEYGFPYSKETAKGISLLDSGFAIVEKLLDCFRDKHFLVFSYNDENHVVLRGLQDKKVINFGMDVYVLNPKRIYVLEMDKTKDLQKYDT